MLIVNTAADSQFFIKLLSLIGSIKKNDKADRKIKVWNIGLTKEQKDILCAIYNVSVCDIPPFMNNWQACYAWKIYVFSHIQEHIAFYMDTGMSVTGNLDCIAKIIKKNGYFAISQGVSLSETTPDEFWEDFKIEKDKFKDSEQFGAGLFGFKKTDENNNIINQAYKYTLKGYTMGYSNEELWRDKHNVNLVRDCKLFRHDQTLLNLFFRKFKGNPVFSDSAIFANPKFLNDGNQIICCHRSIFLRYIFYLFLVENLIFKFRLLRYLLKKKLYSK